MKKKNTSKRTITLQAGKNVRLEKALEAMEHRVSQQNISFSDVAASVREYFIQEYLPIYFSQISPSAVDLKMSALEAISFYEGRIKFLERLISEARGLSAAKPVESSSVEGSSFEEYKGYHDESFDGSDDPASDRFSLALFETADSGSG